MKNPTSEEPFDENEEFEPISKSQIKREMLALQKLGEKLCSLPLKVVNDFDLDERLFSAYETAQTIHSNVAKKRHRQFVGKILRKLPPETVELLEKQIKEYDNDVHSQTDKFHQIEAYRDEILTFGDKAINQLLDQYPILERTYLRQLVRNANKEKEKQKPPKSARLLFKYLKENISED